MRRQRLPLFCFTCKPYALDSTAHGFRDRLEFFGGKGQDQPTRKNNVQDFKDKTPGRQGLFGRFFVKTTYGVCALKDMPTAANAGNQAYALFFRSRRYGLFLGGDFAFGFVIDRVLFGAFLGLFLGFRRLRSDIIRIKRGSD